MCWNKDAFFQDKINTSTNKKAEENDLLWKHRTTGKKEEHYESKYGEQTKMNQ